MTHFYKHIFPLLWFCLLGMFLILEFKAGHLPLFALLVPVAMMALGYLLFRILLFDLMDEVWDNGNELIILNEGHAEHLPLAGIVNVSYSGLTNPKRVTLSLRHPGRWGGKVTFMPPLRFTLALMSNPLVDELIKRVDQARTQA